MPLPQSGQHPNAVDMSPLQQLWREIRSNARDWVNDQNLNRSIGLDVSAGGTIVLTVDQQFAGALIELTGTPAGAFTIEMFAGGTFDVLLENGTDKILLEDGSGVLVLDGSFENTQMIYKNSTSQIATIDTATGATPPVTVTAGGTSIVQTYGAEIVTIGIVGLEDGALLETGDVDPTAEINFARFEVARPLLIDYAFKMTSPTIASGVLLLDMELGNYFDVLLDEDVTTLTLQNPTGPASMELEDGTGDLLLEGTGDLLLEGSGTSRASTIIMLAKQDGVGGWEITWPANVEWEQDSGVSPSQTLDADAQDIFHFTTIDGGVTWQGIIVTLDTK